MRPHYRYSNWKIGIVVAIATLGTPLCNADDTHKSEALGKLLQALPSSKMSLADGIQQAAKTGDAPISAKFEFDDHGKLSLSVYTAEKGLTVAPEKNILKELSGSPQQAAWKPEIEVFKDAEHITRASQQLALMSNSPYSLLEIVNKAQTRAPGNAFAIIPGTFKGIPVAVVELAVKESVVELLYNLKNGDLAGGTPPYGSREDD